MSISDSFPILLITPSPMAKEYRSNKPSLGIYKKTKLKDPRHQKNPAENKEKQKNGCKTQTSQANSFSPKVPTKVAFFLLAGLSN